VGFSAEATSIIFVVSLFGFLNERNREVKK